MNYNFISQLLDNGISEDQIIASLSKTVPHLAKKAKKMMSGGWSSKDILNVFSKDKEAQKSARKGLKPATPSEMATMNLQNSYSNIPKGASEQSKETLTQFTKDVAPYALGYAGSKIAAPMAEYALSRALPNTSPLLKQAAKSIGNPLQMPTQQTQPSPVGNSNQYDTSQQPPLSNANAASIPEPINIEQPKGNSSIVDKLYSGFEKGRDKGFDFESDAFLKVAKRMKSTGEIRSKEDFEKFFNLFDAKKNEGKDLPTALKEASGEYDNERLTPNEQPEENDKLEGMKNFGANFGTGMTDNLYNGLFESLQKGSDTFAGIKDPILKRAKEPFEKGLIKSPQDLKDFANGKAAQMQPQVSKELEQPSKELEASQQETERPKIEKNSVVNSPEGVGEVKEIRNGQAIVEVDGKLHKVKEEELQLEPEEVRKAKIEFNLDDVPEDLRSAPLNEVYAPAHRKHVTIKYNSDIGKDKSKRYIFFKKDGSPVDENLIENLRKGSQLPMTSGKTFWGGWSADTQDSRGTVAYHELTKLAQKEGEEDDPTKPYWFEEEEEVFTHGYSKMAEKKLKEEEKKFNEANKKPKKKRA